MSPLERGAGKRTAEAPAEPVVAQDEADHRLDDPLPRLRLLLGSGQVAGGRVSPGFVGFPATLGEVPTKENHTNMNRRELVNAVEAAIDRSGLEPVRPIRARAIREAAKTMKTVVVGDWNDECGNCCPASAGGSRESSSCAARTTDGGVVEGRGLRAPRTVLPRRHR